MVYPNAVNPVRETESASQVSFETVAPNKGVKIGLLIFMSTILISFGVFAYYVLQDEATSTSMNNDYQARYVQGKCIDDTGIYMADSRLPKIIAQTLHYPDTSNVSYFDYNNKQPYFSRIISLLDEQKKGIFIDVGAGSGHLSHFLEDMYSWTGLLIDVDSTTIRNLLASKRKSYISEKCVGLLPYSYFGIFEYVGQSNRLVLPISKYARFVRKEMCYPLFSFMMSLDISELDLLIIDINGQELNVLQTLPYPDIIIKMIVVNCHNKLALNQISDYLEKKNFKLQEVFDNTAIFLTTSFKEIVHRKLTKFREKHAAINQYVSFNM